MLKISQRCQTSKLRDRPFHCIQQRLCVVTCPIWIAALTSQTAFWFFLLTKLEIRWHSCSVTSHQNNHWQRCYLLSWNNLGLCWSISSQQNLLTTGCLTKLVDPPSIPSVQTPLPSASTSDMIATGLTWKEISEKCHWTGIMYVQNHICHSACTVIHPHGPTDKPSLSSMQPLSKQSLS